MPANVSRTSGSRVAVTVSPALMEGASGAEVRKLQKALLAAGFNPQGVDGDFGPNTRNALMAFQKARGIKVDGKAGIDTWKKLRLSDAGQADRASRTGPLREGDLGADVLKLQQVLARVGLYKGEVDGNFGTNTRQAVVDLQRFAGMNADGVVRPDLWSVINNFKLSAPAPTPSPIGQIKSVGRPGEAEFRLGILSAARAELGTMESGKNRGAILKYPKAFGRGSEAWCADFCSYIMNKAGGSMNQAYCPTVVNELKKNGNWKGKSNPEPGDLVLFDWGQDGKADHIGIVESVNRDGSINTIEGNAKDRDGDQGVFRHTRSLSVIKGFGSPY